MSTISEIFNRDFTRVVDANRAHNETPMWAITLRHMREPQLKLLFLWYLRVKVHLILSDGKVPTFQDIKSIEWDQTAQTGVYAIALEWDDAEQMEGHVFIGSTANATAGGLAGCKARHIAALKANSNATFLQQLWNLNPSKPPKITFHTLLVFPLGVNPSASDEAMAALVCQLSEALLQTWLGTFNFTAPDELVHASAFHPYNRLEWAGANTGFGCDTRISDKSLDSYMQHHPKWMEDRWELLTAFRANGGKPLSLWVSPTAAKAANEADRRTKDPLFRPPFQVVTLPVHPDGSEITPEWLKRNGIESCSAADPKRIQTIEDSFEGQHGPQTQDPQTQDPQTQDE